MKTIISWYALKQFAMVFCGAIGLNLLLTTFDSDFDLETQISPKNLLFILFVTGFITLLIITRRNKRQSTNA